MTGFQSRPARAGEPFHWAIKVVLFKIALVGVLSICCGTALAAPYIPRSGDEVLERLPSRNDPGQRELRQLRAALALRPRDAGLALRLSHLYVDLWRQGGDPRYLGYAQAALAPWWDKTEVPVPVQVMRATLRQSAHQFPEALVDLNEVVNRDPNNVQAWLTRATVLQVIGNYPEATKSCTHLEGPVTSLVTVSCFASVGSVSGQAAQSYQRLSEEAERVRNAMPELHLWAQTLLAEMAERLGDSAGARRHFEAALKAATPDNYLLAAYADFLLLQQEPSAVLELLKSKTNVDTLLLRYCIALKALNSTQAGVQSETLTQRFQAAQMRGDLVHLREQARFALEVKNDARSALPLAMDNWKVQKEPADTLLILQAALAAGDKKTAESVLAWVRKAGLEDVRVDRLKTQLELTR